MVVTLLVIRKTLMITAAVVSSRRAPRIRPSGRASESCGSPRTLGMTATPVSKPDRPNASFGKTSTDSPTTSHGSPCPVVSAVVQSPTALGCVTTRHSESATTTAFSVR